METFYPFVRGLLAWIATIACLWPINVPILGFAFRASCGPKRPDMEANEFWTRSTFGALFLALGAFAALIVDYFLAESLAFPAGPVHLIVLACLIPIGMWICFVLFACDELGQGLTIILIFLLLPIFTLYVIRALLDWLFDAGFWDPLLNMAYGWLKETL